jgi:hypothetical protein
MLSTVKKDRNSTLVAAIINSDELDQELRCQSARTKQVDSCRFGLEEDAEHVRNRG